MTSFIENYCGEWENESGNRIEIKFMNEKSVLATFYRTGEENPMPRPWLGNKPARSMLGTLNTESQASLDIDLSDGANSFCLNLSFDFTGPDYNTCTPSIIRLEGEEFLEQYYELLEPLHKYKKC